jgi:hypothetical protein
MSFKQWIRDSFGPEARSARAARGGKSLRKAKSLHIPRVEFLESRLTLTVYTVSSLADHGGGTLRDAIADAIANPGADTIQFSSSIDGGTISLSGAPLNDGLVGQTAFRISDTLTIDGRTGLTKGITIERTSSAAAFRLFYVHDTGNLTLESLTLRGGRAQGGAGGSGDGAGGGGAAGMGGAIYNHGTLRILNSTLTGNLAQGGAGGNRNAEEGPGNGGGGLGAPGGSGGTLVGGGGGGPNAGSGGDPAYDGYAGGFGGGGGGGGKYQFVIPLVGDGGAGGFGGGGGGGGSDGYGTLHNNFKGASGGAGGFGGGGGGAGHDNQTGNPDPGGGGFGAGSGGEGGGGGGGAGMGGAIFSRNGSVTITNSTFYDNKAIGGGGGLGVIAAGQTGVSGGAGGGYGGGVFIYNGTLDVTNSTFTENTAAQNGRGIYVLGLGASTAVANINNNIIGQETATGSELRVSVTAGGKVTLNGQANLIRSTSFETTDVTNNLTGTINSNPQLGPLKNNGGPTQTFALIKGSPAIDAGVKSVAPATDQRGFGRDADSEGTVDIGAFETFYVVANMEINAVSDVIEQDSFLSLSEAIGVTNGKYDFGLLSNAERSQITLLGGDVTTITFDSSLFGKTISLTNVGGTRVGPSAFEISTKIVINGPTGPNGIELAVAAGKTMRLFDVTPSGELTLQYLTLRGGKAVGFNGGYGNGGGAGGGGAGLGGAIFNQGWLKIANSTLTGNTAQGGMGGGPKNELTGISPYGVPVLAGGGGGGGIGGSGGTDTDRTANDGGGPNGGARGLTNGSAGAAGGFGGGGGGGFGSYHEYLDTRGGDGGQGGFGGGGGGGGFGYDHPAPGSYDGTADSGRGGNGGFGGGGGASGSETTRIQGSGGFGGGAAGLGGTNTGGGGAGMGGAIFNEAGTVSITNSTIAGNEARGGLGGPDANLVAGHGNAGQGLGGGVFNHNGILGVISSTLSANTTVNGDDTTLVASGRAIYNLGDSDQRTTGGDDALAAIIDSILGQTDNAIEDFTGVSRGATGTNVTFGDHNLMRKQSGFFDPFSNTTGVVSDADPMLGPLKDNGGPTPTMALLAGSPAIDTASVDTELNTDQRGFSQVGVRDIGAFEVNPPQPQSIDFAAPANKTYGDADFALSAATTSGLLVSYTATGNASVYQDVGGVWYVHIIGAGSATITAHQVGDEIFLAADDVAQNLTIEKANATVVVTPYSVVYDGVAHTSTVTSIVGVNGETGATVGTVDLSGTKHTSAGNYVRDVWSFAGSANYNDISNTTIANTIALGLSALPNWTVNRPYTPDVTAAGRPAPHSFVVTAGTLPTGLTLNANGSFSGSPTVTGDFTFTIQAAKDAIATGNRTYTVRINAAPVIGALAVTQWTKGHTGYTGTMAIGRGSPAYSVVGTPTGMPPGLTAVISGNSIRFNGTPSTAGTFNGRITIKDAAGAQVSRSFTIKINAALSFTPLKLLGYEPGKSYSQTITTAGGTGTRTVSYTLSAPLPSGLTISPPSPTTGAITISGKTNVRTSITITMTLTDAVGAQITKTYTLKWVQVSL